MTAATLKGRLLVALPVLRDRNFDRTVIYVLEQSAEGAVGVVLNRPSPLAIGEPLPKWQPLATEPAVVFIGGPVGPSAAIGVAEASGDLITVDLEQDPEPAVDRVRVFAGYAGWGAGQLEDEIAAGAWVVVNVGPGDVMTDEPEQLWADVLRRQAGRLAAVASFPRDPSLN